MGHLYDTASEKLTYEERERIWWNSTAKKFVKEWENDKYAQYAFWGIKAYLNIKKGCSKKENREWFNKNKHDIVGNNEEMVNDIKESIKAIIEDEMDFTEIKFRYLDIIKFEAIKTIDIGLKGKIEYSADEAEKSFYDEEWCPYYWSREYIKYSKDGNLNQILAKSE